MNALTNLRATRLPNGSLLLVGVIAGQIVRRTYRGFSLSEAVATFRNSNAS